MTDTDTGQAADCTPILPFGGVWLRAGDRLRAGLAGSLGTVEQVNTPAAGWLRLRFQGESWPVRVTDLAACWSVVVL